MKTITYTLLAFAILGIFMLGGCASQDFHKGANTVRLLTNGSFSGAGLNERVANCVKDALDPSNRGSGCN